MIQRTTCFRFVSFDIERRCRSNTVGSVCFAHGSSSTIRPRLSGLLSGRGTYDKIIPYIYIYIYIYNLSLSLYIYIIYIYIYTHTHTYIYIYIYTPLPILFLFRTWQVIKIFIHNIEILTLYFSIIHLLRRLKLIQTFCGLFTGIKLNSN